MECNMQVNFQTIGSKNDFPVLIFKSFLNIEWTNVIFESQYNHGHTTCMF